MLTPEQQQTVTRNRALVEACQQQYNLPANPNIDEELLLYENFPTEESKLLPLLIYAYKKDVVLDLKNLKLAPIGFQADLTILGFSFAFPNYKHNPPNNLNFIITGFNEEEALIEKMDKNRQLFFRLDSIEIANFFCIKKFELKNLSKYKEIYFLGENGDGKTLLLQGMVLAMKNVTIQNARKDSASIGTALQVMEESQGRFLVTPQKGMSLKKRYGFQVLAYGVHRGRRSAYKPEEYGFGTLFSDDVYLRSPEEWLVDLDRLNFRHATSIKFDDAVKMLQELLAENVEIKLNKAGTKLEFTERGTLIAFSRLSEGYKSVITWVVDMLSRLAENQPEEKDMRKFQGIVLVDEISLHLHPKWEFQIVKKLRGWFPNIQFIFTTHSPVNVMGASEDAVFFRLYKEEGETKASEPFYASDMSRLMANSIITSPLFDLESAHMRVYDEKQDLDTSDDYLYARIHKAIAEDVAEMRKAGKKFISTQKLDEMIKKMLEQY